MEHNMSEETSMIDRSEVEQFYNLVNRITRSTVAVIDAVVQRGGFRGEELSTIGQLRDQCIQAVQMCEAFDSDQE
jgi:hypothetical protein